MVKVNECLTIFGTKFEELLMDSIEFSSNENDILKMAVEHDDYGVAYVRASAVEEMLDHLAKLLNVKYSVEYDSEKVKFFVGADYSDV